MEIGTSRFYLSEKSCENVWLLRVKTKNGKMKKRKNGTENGKM